MVYKVFKAEFSAALGDDLGYGHKEQLCKPKVSTWACVDRGTN